MIDRLRTFFPGWSLLIAMAIVMQASPLFSATSLISRRNFNDYYFGSVQPPKSSFKHFIPKAIKQTREETNIPSPSPEEITQKYGLEAGLWKVPNYPNLCFAPSSSSFPLALA